jgi:hypothetical protein
MSTAFVLICVQFSSDLVIMGHHTSKHHVIQLLLLY